jgi:alkylation response protein AidB-like acyl-CoA dehydrogenase
MPLPARCRAVKQADGTFVINGKKSWITSGPVARYICSR